jgi:basic membrane protein A
MAALPQILSWSADEERGCVYNYLKSVADDSVQAGISIGTLQNGVVGLAPFHDWDGRIPDDLKAQIQKADDGIKDGSIKAQ